MHMLESMQNTQNAKYATIQNTKPNPNQKDLPNLQNITYQTKLNLPNKINLTKSNQLNQTNKTKST